MGKLDNIEAPEGFQEVKEDRVAVKAQQGQRLDQVEAPEGFEEVKNDIDDQTMDYVPKKLQGTDLEKDWPFLKGRLFSKGSEGLDLEVNLNEGDFRNAIVHHWGVSPDVAAKAYRIANEGGGRMPTDLVIQNKEELFQWQEASEIFNRLVGGKEITVDGQEKLKFKYPYTANWIKDPDRMAMAKDDVEVLTKLEGEAIRFNRPWYDAVLHNIKEGAKGLGRGALGTLENLRRSKLESEKEFYEANKEIFGDESLDPITRMNAFQALDPFHKKNIKNTEQSIEDLKGMRHGDFLRPTPLSREGGLRDYAYDFFHIVPQLAGTIGTSVLTGPAGGAAFMGQYIFGSSYSDLRDQGVTHDRATTAAIGNTTVQTALEYIPLAKLFTLFKAKGVKQAVRDFFGLLIAESGTEWLQSYPEMVSQIWGTQEVAGRTTEQSIDLMIKSLPETTLQGIYEGLLVAPVALLGGSIKIPYEYARQTRLQKNIDFLAKEMPIVETSKLKERSPEHFDEFMNGVYQTNNISKELRIPLEKIEKYYQDNPEGLQAFLQEMNLLEQYNESPTTDELVIDRATFLRKYANTDLGQAIRGDIRFDVEGLTANETEALRKNITENLKSLQKEYNKQIRRGKLPPQAISMWKTLTKKLDSDKAETNMSIFMAMAKQLASRRGETTQQWFDRVKPSLKIDDNSHLVGNKVLKQNKKGSVEFTDAGAIINLYDSADLSTFLHEAFHIATNDFKSYIESGHADELSKQQYNTLVNFADGKLNNAGFEKLAKAFELYLREGKAPSVGLANAFRAVKTWFKNLYKTLSNFKGVKLNDEVRGVFDRLLSSEQEIEEVKSYYSTKQSLQDLVPLPVEQVRKLQLQRENADSISIDNQVKKHMTAYLKAIGGKEQFKDLANREISKQTVYQAIEYLGENKLDQQDILTRLGPEQLAALKKKHKGIIERKGKDGTSLVELVMLYGYANEEAALNDILNAENKQKAINKRATELVKERENAIRDQLSKGEEIVGEESYHHESQLMYMVAQAEILRENIEKNKNKRLQRLEAKVFQDAARDRISQMPVWKATRYKDYAAAEKRYGQKAVNLLREGKLVEAHEALKMQAINHAMVISSVEARQQRDKIERRYKTKRVSSNLNNVEDSYRNAAVDAITFYKLNPTLETKDLGALLDIPFLSEELAQTMPAWVLRKETPENFKTYRDLPYGQMLELDGAIRNIMAFGKGELKSIKDSLYGTLTAHRAASNARMNLVPDKAVYDKYSQFGKLVDNIDTVLARTKLMSFLLERTDNYSFFQKQEVGPMKYLYDKVLDSEIKYSENREQTLNKLKDSFSVLKKAAKRIEKDYNTTNAPFAVKQYDMPGVQLPNQLVAKGFFKWTFERQLMFMLNLGNTQNRQRLFNSYNYTSEQIDIITSHFTKAELQSIQKIWDAIGSNYPEIDKVHFNLHNKHLEKVEASEISVLSKEGEVVNLEGGYFPLAYDYSVSDIINTKDQKNAPDFLDKDIMTDRRANVLRTKPKDRMTKERSDTNNSFINLSYNVLFNHIEDTSRYISHAEILRDFNMIISDPKWKSTFIKKEGEFKYTALREWLASQATPKSKAHSKDLLEKVTDHQRKLATINVLGLNASVSQKQRLSMANAATEVGYKYLYQSLRDADLKTSVLGLASGRLVNEVFDQSKFMKLRDGAFDREFSDIKYQNRPDVKTFEAFGLEFTWKDVQDGTFAWIQMMDRATAVVVWKAAYNKYVDTHKNVDAKGNVALDLNKALKYADHVVETTQPVSIPTTLNSYMRSDGPLKLFTSFMTFSFLQSNRFQFYYRALQDGRITRGQFLRHTINEAMVPAWTMTIFGSLLYGAGEWPEWWDFFMGPAESYTSGIPLVRDIPSIYRYNKDIGFSPAFEGARKIGRAAWSTKKSLQGDKAWLETSMDLGLALELQVGVPALKFMKDADRLYKSAKGEK